MADNRLKKCIYEWFMWLNKNQMGLASVKELICNNNKKEKKKQVSPGAVAKRGAEP